MPYYLWTNRKTGETVEVLRSIKNYDVPPSNEEYAGQDPEPEWDRLPPANTTWIQAKGYRAGGKGSKGGFVPKTTKRMPDSI